MSSLKRITSILALAAAGLALAACGGGGKKSAESTAAATTAPPAKTTTSAATTTTKGRPVVSPAERIPLEPNKTYTVEFQTSEGTFTVTLDQKASPHTTASFAALVRKKYFDKTTFHRIVPGFILQGGDPTGTGQGFPGYTVVDTPAPDTKYTPGVVAMAKTTVQPPGTAGGQFFIVTSPGDLTKTLRASPSNPKPQYAVLGRVTSGMKIVQKIGKLGDVATELPTKRVVIKRALLHES